MSWQLLLKAVEAVPRKSSRYGSRFGECSSVANGTMGAGADAFSAGMASADRHRQI